MSIRLVPADQVDFEAYVESFNAAYSDYFVPLHMSIEAMARLIQRDAIDLRLSLAALDTDGGLVGLGMLARRDALAWVGGIGVIPTYRAQGIGRLLTQGLIDNARAANCERISLEVIEENKRAHGLYLSLGFQNQRHLDSLERKPDGLLDALEDDSIQIERVEVAEALAFYPAWQNIPNPWQRHPAAIASLSDALKAWLAYQDGEPAAYVIGWVESDFIRFMDIAAAPHPEGEKALHQLLAHVHHLAPYAPSTIINIDATSRIYAEMLTLGYVKTLRQHEMGLELSS